MTYPSQPNPGYGHTPQPQWQPGYQIGPGYGPSQQPGYPQQPFRPRPGRPPRKFWTGVVLGVVLTLVLFVGVGAGVYFGAIKKHGNTNAAASGPFDDLNDLDPCGFVDSDAFADSNIDVHIQPVTLGRCDVDLYLHNIASGYNIVIMLTNQAVDPRKLSDSRAYTAITAVDRLHIAKEAKGAGDSTCTEAIYQDNYRGVTVGSNATGDAIDSSGVARPGYDTCKPADEAVAAIMRAVSGNSPARIQYPKDSLGTTNLCSMVNASDVNTVLNTSGLGLLPRSVNAMCYFAQNDHGIPPRMLFAAELNTPENWRNNNSDSYTTIVTIAGRQTSVYNNPNSVATGHETNLCWAETLVKTWQTWPGRIVVGGPVAQSRGSDADITTPNVATLLEVANVSLTLPPGNPSDCTTAAKALAAKIWPLLPPATP